MSRVDWKFIGQLILAALAVIVTVLVYFVDLDSRSLHMRTISRVPLQPQQANAVSELQMSFEGQKLNTPYITILEIINDGLRPIPAASFELPLEIWTLSDVKIVRARVIQKTPLDLQPGISWTDNALKLKPLLLNPNDSIKFMLITSGGAPEFSPRARIEGVASITQEDQEDLGKKKIKRFVWIEAVTAFVLWIAYWVAHPGWVRPSVPLGKHTMLLITLSTLSGATILTAQVVYSLEGSFSAWSFIPACLIAALCASFVAPFISESAKVP